MAERAKDNYEACADPITDAWYPCWGSARGGKRKIGMILSMEGCLSTRYSPIGENLTDPTLH